MNEQAKHIIPHEWPSTLDADVLENLLDIVADKANLDRSALVPSATMDSLNIPSLDMIDILFGVEEKFNIYVPMGDELSNVVYLHDLMQVLADQMRLNAGAHEPKV